MIQRLVLPIALLAALCGVSRTAHADVYKNQISKAMQYLTDAEKAYQAGNTARQRELAIKAEKLFRDATTIRPRDTRAYFLGCIAAGLAQSLERGNRWLAEYSQRSAYGKADPDAYFLRAYLAYYAGRHPEAAIRYLETMYGLNARARGRERDTIWYAALLMSAEQFAQKKKWDHGIHRLQEAERIARKRGWRNKVLAARGNYAILLRRGNRLKEAIPVLTGMIASDPGSPIWYMQRARAYAGELRWDEAITDYRMVVELLKTRAQALQIADHKEVYLRLGNCLRHTVTESTPAAKRDALRKEALENLKKYVALAPKDARGHKWIGAFYFEDLEQPYKAIPYYQKALELDWACLSNLRDLIQIHRIFPPPPDQLPKNDPAAAEQVRAAWKKRLAAYEKDLADNVKKRDEELERRQKSPGGDTCE